MTQQLELMDKKFDELSRYFAFDRKKISIEDFFGDLIAFIKDFDVSRTLIASAIQCRVVCARVACS